MDTFLERYNLPKLNYEEAESLNRLRADVEIEAVIKKLPTHKSTGPHGFTGEFYKALKKQLLDSLILRIVLLVSMLFNSAVILVISFLLLTVGFFCCHSSSF